MAELTRRFPNDVEARSFYALSILGLTRTTRSTENYMRAAAIAEAIYETNPKHPGALHYLIHAYDDPVHAPLGIRAARLYGTVARSASHAQHMPSHIFFALGMWEDSIVSNTASMKTARDEGGGGYHPLHWLQHGYLQLGRTDDALKVLTIIEDDNTRISTNYARNHLAMCRATMLVETQEKAPASAMETVDATGILTQTAFAGHDMAIGLEHVRRQDVTAARRMLESIRSRSGAMKQSKADGNATVGRYSSVAQTDVDTVAVMEQILDAAIEFASGNRDNGIQKAIAAGEAEDKLIFEYGPPAIVKPAWELAGEILLIAGRKSEAANAFRRALKRYPNRRLSNEGLKDAAR
jgi:tetratricopeptide (TPR) repeat protein